MSPDASGVSGTWLVVQAGSSSVTRKAAVLRQCSAVTLERTLCEDRRVLREVAAE
jgi:hypothetical protein